MLPPPPPCRGRGICFARCCSNCRSACQLGVTCGDDDDDCGGSVCGGGGTCDDCVQDGALAIASRISCDSCPHTIIPKSSDGCWGSSTPAADIAAAVPRQHVHYAGAEAGGVAHALHPHAAARVGGSPHRVTPAGAFMNAAGDDCVVGEAVVPTQPRACSTRTAPAVSAAMPPRSSTSTSNPRVNPRPALTPSPRNRLGVGTQPPNTT